MNERIKQLAGQAGGEFWQRIESDGVLNKEAYITFDPPQSLEKFVQLIAKECADIANKQFSAASGLNDRDCWTAVEIKKHFGAEK